MWQHEPGRAPAPPASYHLSFSSSASVSGDVEAEKLPFLRPGGLGPAPSPGYPTCLNLGLLNYKMEMMLGQDFFFFLKRIFSELKKKMSGK